MKTASIVLCALALAGLGVGAEQKLQRKDVPAAVEKTVKQEEANGGTIKNIAAEKAGGKTVYEVETTVRGHTRDLIVDATGTIVEAEEEVSIDAVPAPVKTALQASGKVIKIETLTKDGKTTYEAQVEKNGKRSEVALDAAGKPVKG